MFFINLADNEILDHKDRTPEHYGFCAFGEVTEGLSVSRNGPVCRARHAQAAQHSRWRQFEIKSVQRLR